MRTALNTRISWWRRRRREIVGDPPDTAAAGQRRQTSYAHLDAPVLAAVRDLPPRQREVIALRVLLDLDTATTARALGIAPGTVTTHLTRAVATLRERLTQTLEEETRTW